MTYQCQYCKKDFIKETSLEVHSCEPRRRRQEKDERGVQLGFQAYIKFYEMMQGTAKLKTFDDFADSSYYKAFVKFGRYCYVIRAINPARFIEWLLKNNKKLDRWCSDQLYTEYLIQHLRIEHVNDALARSIEWSIAWGEEHDAPPHDCLRYGNTNTICYALTTGRLSPWCIYNSNSGIEFLSSLTQDQIAMIWSYIESDFWQKKFRDYPADVEYVKDILQKAGW